MRFQNASRSSRPAVNPEPAIDVVHVARNRAELAQAVGQLSATVREARLAIRHLLAAQ